MSTSVDRGRWHVHVEIQAATDMTEIRVSDARFQRVKLPGIVGFVEVDLPEGRYEFAFRDGTSWQRQVAVIQRQRGDGAVQVQQEKPTQRMGPLEAIELSLEEDIASQPATTDPQSRVSLFVRSAARDEDSQSGAADDLLAGLSLVDESGTTAQESTTSPRGMLHFHTSPGRYRLRLESGLEGQVVEMPLFVCSGWETRVYLPSLRYGAQENWRADLSRAAVRMQRPGNARDDASLLPLEANALHSLASGKRLYGASFNARLSQLLKEDFQSPMLGLYWGYLFACEKPDEYVLLEDIVGKLSETLVLGSVDGGPPVPHPDVQALQLRLRRCRGERFASEDASTRFPFPPMLLASWVEVLKLASRIPAVVPSGSLSDLVASRVWANSAWMVWSVRSKERLTGGRGVEDLQKQLAASTPPIESALRIIDVALHHRVLREWFRTAPELSRVERLVGQRVHPVSESETHQARLERLRTLPYAGRQPRPTWTVEQLARDLSLPANTAARAALEMCNSLLAEGARHTLDLRARSSMAIPEVIIPYDPKFLGDGFTVPLPQLTPALKPSALFEGSVLDYTHFSLVMSTERKVALFTAANVDASRMVRVGRDVPWRMDERAGEFQLGPEVYANNQLDRGHLVRRQDVLWGSVNEAKLANSATFFYTNAAPQHQNFNQDEWLCLEDWVLERATDFSYRLCVFTGPVLRPDDPILSDLPPDLRTAFRAFGPAQIPAAFWKAIVLRDSTSGGDDLSVVCFAMRQSEMWNDKDGRRLLNLHVHQVTLQTIEKWTGLDFKELRNADELEWADAQQRNRAMGREPEWPVVRSAEDIVYSGSTRRARGIRAPRTQDRVLRRASMELRAVEATSVTCGCTERFDAREAIAALGQEIARLTDVVADQNIAPQQPRAQGAGRSIGLAPISWTVSLSCRTWG